MREFVKEGPRLYAVPPLLFTGEVSDFTRMALDQSYKGWLRAVQATEELNMSAQAIMTRSETGLQRTFAAQRRSLQLCPPANTLLPGNNDVIHTAPTKLTTNDYVQVMLATIREGGSHARWPREVVAHFLTAEVVR